jgi:pimeloyl-ACP methyl ester carboxylesterase
MSNDVHDTSAAADTVPAGTDTEIRPFRIDIPQAEIDDLRRRLADVRWPDPAPAATGPGLGSGSGGGPGGAAAEFHADAGWSRGVPVEHLRRIAERWADGYDWRRHEAELNELPQFTTVIDGQTVHFVHVRSPEPDALPLVMTHGYPSSFAEFRRTIGPLTDPRAHGGDPADAFHVVVPSVPGFGFSTPLAVDGWEVGRTARAWAELMHRLGYERYAVHGGDIGAGVAGDLPKVDPGVVAVHVNTDVTALALVGGLLPDAEAASDWPRAEQERLEQLRAYEAEGRGYLQIQTTRPETLAYGLTDSPVAQLAWIVEKFHEWTDPASGLLDLDGAGPDGFDGLDRVLTNVSIYWFTRSGASAGRFIHAAAHAEMDWSPSPVATGFAVFGAEPVIRRLIDPEHQVAHWSEFAEGGHFPAHECPELLVDDLRRYLRPHRGS